MTAGCRTYGEISAGALIVQEGAYFEGNSKMSAPGSAPAAAHTNSRSDAHSTSSSASSRASA